MTNLVPPVKPSAKPQRGSSGRLIVLSAVFMLALPLINAFALNFILLRISGDVMFGDVYSVLTYVSDALTAAASYIGAGLLCVSLCKYGMKRSASVIAMYIISLLLPYAGLILTTAWNTTDFAENAVYYLVMSLMYFALDIVIFAAIMIICALVRRRFAARSTDKTTSREKNSPAGAQTAISYAANERSVFSPRKNPICLALMLCCGAILLVAIAGEAVNTVGFFVDYGFTATPSEVVSIVTAYLVPIAQFVIAYVINCLIAAGTTKAGTRLS